MWSEWVFGARVSAMFDFYEIVIFIVEWLPWLVAMNIVLVCIASSTFRKYCIFALPGVLGLFTILCTGGSYIDAYGLGYDLGQPSLRMALETYVEVGKGPAGEGLDSILEDSKYAPTFGKLELVYLLKDLFAHSLLHLDQHNADNIAEGYNKGNDWFQSTLGEPMVYTSGIYKNGNESLWEAQRYKLDYVADSIELQKGEKVLDIGCGWGRLVQHMSDKYGAHVTGISLSEEQVKFGKELNKHNDGNIMLQDAMTYAGADKSFDKITSLEMAEHVGIQRYTQFLRKVHSLLKDDGILYFQVAGLRRQWQYEDLVWGLFMGEHVFPGADASCPMGWVTTQLERAGFEVQRVQNLGSHYSRTLDQWLQEWHAKKDQTVKKYGEKAYRRWEVFLRWSVRIARTGSSTVFMITAVKQGMEKTRVRSQRHLAPQLN